MAFKDMQITVHSDNPHPKWSHNHCTKSSISKSLMPYWYPVVPDWTGCNLFLPSCFRAWTEEFCRTTLEVPYVNEQRLRAVLNQLARLTLIIPGERITPRLLCNLLISVKLYMDYCCCEIHVQQAALETSMSKSRNWNATRVHKGCGENRIKGLDAFITSAKAIVQTPTM